MTGKGGRGTQRDSGPVFACLLPEPLRLGRDVKFSGRATLPVSSSKLATQTAI